MASPRCAYIAACFVLAGAAPAAAQTWEVPQGWRFISVTESTSQCIGRPTSPLCAVETVKACFLRGDAYSLCIDPPKAPLPASSPDVRAYYYVEAIREFSEQERLERGQMTPALEVGDVLVVLFDNGCRPDDSCAPIQIVNRYFYHTRQYPKGTWRVITRYSDMPEADDYPRPPPGRFRSISAGDASSECIGDPIDPVCATETFLACLLLWQDVLCATAERADVAPSRIVTSASIRPPFRYEIVGPRQAAPQDIDGDDRWRLRAKVIPGDVIIDLVLQNCEVDEAQCDSDRFKGLMSHLLRQKPDDTWMLVDFIVDIK